MEKRVYAQLFSLAMMQDKYKSHLLSMRLWLASTYLDEAGKGYIFLSKQREVLMGITSLKTEKSLRRQFRQCSGRGYGVLRKIKGEWAFCYRSQEKVITNIYGHNLNSRETAIWLPLEKLEGDYKAVRKTIYNLALWVNQRDGSLTISRQRIQEQITNTSRITQRKYQDDVQIRKNFLIVDDSYSKEQIEYRLNRPCFYFRDWNCLLGNDPNKTYLMAQISNTYVFNDEDYRWTKRSARSTVSLTINAPNKAYSLNNGEYSKRLYFGEIPNNSHDDTAYVMHELEQDTGFNIFYEHTPRQLELQPC